MLTDLEKKQVWRKYLMEEWPGTFHEYKGSFYTYDTLGNRVGHASSGGNSHVRRKVKRKLLHKGFKVEMSIVHIQ